MAPNIFGNTKDISSVKYFEIRYVPMNTALRVMYVFTDYVNQLQA